MGNLDPIFLIVGLSLLLLLVGIVMWVASRQHEKASSKWTEPVAPRPKDDLSSLGILRIGPQMAEEEDEDVDDDEDVDPLHEFGDVHPAAPRDDHAAPSRRSTTSQPSGEDRVDRITSSESVAPKADGSSGTNGASDDQVRIAGSDEVWGPDGVSKPRPVPRSGGTTTSSSAPISPRPTVAASGSMSAINWAARASQRLVVQAQSTEIESDALLPTLVSIEMAFGANTVAIVRQADASLTYELLAVVGRNAFTRRLGTFTSPSPLISPRMVESPVTIRKVGSGMHGEVSPSLLGYYSEAISIRHIAIAPLLTSADQELYFLLIDSRNDRAFDHPEHPTMITAFAQVVKTMLGRQEHADVVSAVARPRREIIAEEMHRARSESSPLALALVYLNGAEQLEIMGDASIVAAERALNMRLQSVSDSYRIERFGELMFGVFLSATTEEIEDWTANVQEALFDAEGEFSSGVSIGVAVMADRHHSADNLRSDATLALQEALSSGHSTVLE